MLYLQMIKDKYIEIYNEFISQLQIYAKAVRILAKGYLPISLIMPLKLQEILNSVKETQTKSNPDYDIVIKRLHLYYNMKLVTFGIDRKMKSYYSIPNFHTTLYPTAINFISNRDCFSPYCRPKYQSRFLYGNYSKETVYNLKF